MRGSRARAAFAFTRPRHDTLQTRERMMLEMRSKVRRRSAARDIAQVTPRCGKRRAAYAPRWRGSAYRLPLPSKDAACVCVEFIRCGYARKEPLSFSCHMPYAPAHGYLRLPCFTPPPLLSLLVSPYTHPPLLLCCHLLMPCLSLLIVYPAIAPAAVFDCLICCLPVPCYYDADITLHYAMFLLC